MPPPSLIERAPAGTKPPAGMRLYRPHGAVRDLWASRDQELVIAGPADTGKSLGALHKLHICALTYPGMRGLILRKTRSSLTESGLVTFEQKVLPPGSPIAAGVQREQRHSYRYPNSSELIVGGLDDPVRHLSSEYDMIYVQEAREATENDWELALTRCTGRAGNMPFSQLIGDTNPDHPQHWIKRRANRGQLRLLESRHEDNPTITAERLAVLDALTGVRKKRLRLGLWVAAEGIVYDGYDPAVHLIDPFRIPSEWDRYLAVDFGYSNPFVAQWWAVDADGRLVLYRELYRTQSLVEDLAHEIRRHSSGEPIRAIVCDHDAEDRATLAKHLSWCECRAADGLEPVPCGTTAARKDVSPGLQAVAQRLRPAGDGRARITLVRDALVGRDPLLEDRKLPCSTEEEFESYVWDTAQPKFNPDGTARKEEPLKLNDHGMDAMRYMVAHLDLGSGLLDLIGQSIPIGYGDDVEDRSPMTVYRTRTPRQIDEQRRAALEAMLRNDDDA